MVAVLGGALCACSLLLSTSPQCKSDGDCRARGASFAQALCREGYCESDASAADAGLDSAPDVNGPDARDNPRWCEALTSRTAQIGGKSVGLEIFTESLANGMPTSDGIIRICSIADVGCANPRPVVGGDAAAPDGGGKGWVAIPPSAKLTASVEDAFSGAIEFQSGKYAPMLDMVAPIFEPLTGYTITAVTPSEVQMAALLAAGRPGAYDPMTRGVVFAIVRDCNRADLAGMRFDVGGKDSAAFGFYFQGGLPSSTATQTESSGRGGFGNLLPGIYTVTATDAATGKLHGSSALIVRAGTITIVSVLPSL